MSRESTFYILLGIICFLHSCSVKSPEQEIRERFTEYDITTLLDSVSGKYMKMEWDSVNVDVDYHTQYETQLVFYGYGKCKEYANESFYVYSVYKMPAGDTKGIPNYQSVHIEHNQLGEIISTLEYGMPTDKRISANEFIEKLDQYKKLQAEIKSEREHYVRLAYQNKTKVHFGMSAEEYNNTDKEFKKNFFDGLVGRDAYENVKPTFGKKGLVGFEVHGSDNHPFSYSHMEDNAHLADSRTSNGTIRFTTYYSIYKCHLYNAEISTQIDGASKESICTVKVWWNSYLKIYN